jgi:glycosyltransferase involved in cell wall biosynthesis
MMNSSGQHAPSVFIIATYNRPEELLRTVHSLVNQTVLPSELCIVDASDRLTAGDEIELLCRSARMRFVYKHPAPRSLTAQRNLGVDSTTGNPVFFIDDDVELEPSCHEQVLLEYQEFGG